MILLYFAEKKNMSADTTAPSMHEEEEEEEDDEEEDVSEEDSLRKRARCMFLQMIMPDKLQGGGKGESGAFTKNTPPRVWMVDAIDKPKTMEENASRPTKLVKMKLVIMPATCRTPFEGQVLATFLKEAVEKEAW